MMLNQAATLKNTQAEVDQARGGEQHLEQKQISN